MTSVAGEVVAGVDTHADTHHVAVIDLNGARLGDREFSATGAGYRELLAFVASFGDIRRVGVEGTGSYGAGLARSLRQCGVAVVEVIRPNRQVRRLRGKSDPIDAYEAARTALSHSDHPVPKHADGPVEAIRFVLAARRSAIKARTAAQVQIKSLLVTAPEAIRQRFRELDDRALIERLAGSRASSDAGTGPMLFALRSLARRHQGLGEDIAQLDAQLAGLVDTTNPELTATKGIGTVVAAQLLVTAGDNPERLRNEAAFAALCGVSPIPASSGKTHRHRLNRGGDRQANAALHRIALVRMSYEPRTRDYVARKRAEGHTSKEIIRCLKRAIAREVFRLLTGRIHAPRIDDLRPTRLARGISMTTAAEHLGVWPALISNIERGIRRNDQLATAYRAWLLTA